MGSLHGLLRRPIKPDIEALKSNLRREGTPRRVHLLELAIDLEIRDAVCRAFGIGAELDPADPYYLQRREILLQRFLGYDVVRWVIDWPGFPADRLLAADTTQAIGQGRRRRQWMAEHHGLVADWVDFDRYPWPSAADIRTDSLEWLSRELPDDMGIYVMWRAIYEQVVELMGFEAFCLALYDQPDLVEAIFERVGGILHGMLGVLLQFPRVGILFSADDMGFKTQTMVSPQFLLRLALPWHKRDAALVHERGKLFLLHSCGNLRDIMLPLIKDVRLDGKQSFEDAIQPVTEAKRLYGGRIAVVGGIDVDLLCRGSEEEIRARVREVLDVCLPGGGYCLGTGNTVANYIPLRSYLVMLDEGRRYA